MTRFLVSMKVAALGACFFAAVAHAEPQRDLAQEQANQSLVLGFYDDFFNKHQTAEAAKVVAGTYKQHNPSVPDGKASFVNYFTEFYRTHPDARSEVVRSAAQGDLVYMHLHSRPDSTSRGNAIVNVFRVEHGQITEHWDVIQPVPAESANTNGMFGGSEPKSSKPRDIALESANQKIVLDFYDGVFNQHKVAESSQVVSPSYIQHNPEVPDGKAPFVDYFTGYFKDHPQASARVVRSVAQDDLVWLHVHSKASAQDRGQAVVDIFRVKDGQIVEHWDVIQEVPEKPANSNGMFD
ncbi:ester cyclase [Pseudomonas syringae]|uniref:nuclear transport factor 2 family protein n=1 Tax=Pseudomonas syringae TaxID=317 RepID=UPI00215B4C8E|nr:nuclear transport factor 2 family protein [Pseudomonas syringae]MCR8718248.1 ester cyclase [Pseudomonas syringae]